MLEPRKRTALDGKEWWCVYDKRKNRKVGFDYMLKARLSVR